MKRWLAIAALVGLSAFGANADNFWGLYLSYWDTADLDHGIGPGAVLSAEMIPAVQMEARVSLFDDLSDDEDAGVPEVGVVPVELGLTVGLPSESPVRGYVGIGAGYYVFDVESDPAWDGDPDDAFGYYGLAGIGLPIWTSEATYGATRALLFAETMYRSVELDMGDSGDTFDLDGAVVNVGILIGW